MWVWDTQHSKGRNISWEFVSWEVWDVKKKFGFEYSRDQ